MLIKILDRKVRRLNFRKVLKNFFMCCKWLELNDYYKFII